MVIKYNRLPLDEIGNLYYRSITNKLNVHITVIQKEKYLTLLAIAALFLLLISTFLDPHNEDDCFDQEFEKIFGSSTHLGAVIDCGSSGSRVHIFKWQLLEDGQLPRIHILKDEHGKPITKQISPGLSDFKKNPSKASDYLDPLMDFLDRAIPKKRRFLTPIYLLSTAGMRLLDKQTQDKIINDIDRDLRDKYHFPKLKAEVISGPMEGAYAWISLNLDRILNSTTIHVAKNRFGIIDLGGASLQVTFEITNEIESKIASKLGESGAIAAFRKERLNITLGQTKYYNLFSTTFLGLGVNQAHESAQDLLVQEYLTSLSNGSAVKSDIILNDPCLNRSFNQTSLSSKFRNNLQAQIFFNGSSDFIACSKLIKRVITQSKHSKLNCQNLKSCPMSLLHTPFIPFEEYSFVGISEFFYATNSTSYNRYKLVQLAEEVCSTKYKATLSNFPCFKASYILTLLDSFGVPEEYVFKAADTDWSLGAIYKKVLDSIPTPDPSSIVGT